MDPVIAFLPTGNLELIFFLGKIDVGICELVVVLGVLELVIFDNEVEIWIVLLVV